MGGENSYQLHGRQNVIDQNFPIKIIQKSSKCNNDWTLLDPGKMFSLKQAKSKPVLNVGT